MNFHQTCYELLSNLLWTSIKLLMNLLKVLTDFLWILCTFYKLLIHFLLTSFNIQTSVLCTSYKLLMNFYPNFLCTSYKLLMNFYQTSCEPLETSYKLLMNCMHFLQTSYALHPNFLLTSFNIQTSVLCTSHKLLMILKLLQTSYQLLYKFLIHFLQTSYLPFQTSY